MEEFARQVTALWTTCEPAKTHALRRIVEELAMADPATPDLFQSTVKQCIIETQDKIEDNDFPQPADWIFSISSLLNLARAIDDRGIIRDSQSHVEFVAELNRAVNRLRKPPEERLDYLFIGGGDEESRDLIAVMRQAGQKVGVVGASPSQPRSRFATWIEFSRVVGTAPADTENVKEVERRLSDYGYSNAFIARLRHHLASGSGEHHYHFEHRGATVFLDVGCSGKHLHVFLSPAERKARVFDSDARNPIEDIHDDSFRAG